MAKRYKTIFQVRRGTMEEWNRINPLLRAGEPGFAVDKSLLKIGDGIHHWRDLPQSDSILLDYQSRAEFPEVGVDRLLYRDIGTASLYQWNSERNQYELLSSLDGLEDMLDQKVDKIEGKGLSTNDFTTELRAKLESLQGKDDISYLHNQLQSSKEWIINHNLEKYPSVTVVDSAGTIVVGEVNYLNENQVIITFSGAFSGKAYLN